MTAAAVVPPTVLPEAASISTPSLALPRAAIPALSVPMKLPSTVLPVADDPLITMPTWLPEMTCGPLRVVPPMVLPDALSISTPAWTLPRSASPVESVPIRLPMTVTPVAGGPGDQDADQVGGDHVSGADHGARGGVGHASLVVAQDRVPPVAVRPMMLFGHRIASGIGPGDIDAVSLIGGDDVADAGRGSADLIIGCVVDPDAVA